MVKRSATELKLASPKPPTSELGSGRLEMKLTSDPANIAAVRHAVEDLGCRKVGLDQSAAGEVGLCVNEALANVMRHAYEGATGKPIVVTAQCQEDALVVTIRDWGNGVNPATVPHPPFDPLKPGGLGLICLTRMMSEVNFVPQKDGMLLIMKKRKSKTGNGKSGTGKSGNGNSSSKGKAAPDAA
jgi:serine/threonine-protein kinase RsbW